MNSTPNSKQVTLKDFLDATLNCDEAMQCPPIEPVNDEETPAKTIKSKSKPTQLNTARLQFLNHRSTN